jgi:cytochrome c-type biogenesis protein CcmF
VFALWLVTLKTDGSAFNAAALIVGGAVCLGFSLVVILVAKPFSSVSARPDDGEGLNPVLQSLWMVIHPPAFILAYSVFIVPFVVVVASVFGGDAEVAELYLPLRRWLLAGIGFLSLGIAAGARWAHSEADWGGYWAWDPMQSLSLVLWLAAVAALHSVNAMQSAFGGFRRWILVLGPAPFVLCLFLSFVGTSNILESVYTFGRSTMGGGLLGLAGACSLLWLVCIIRAVRAVPIAPAHPSSFRFGTDRIMLWSNIGFVVTAGVIGIVTFLPVILRLVMRAGAINIPTRQSLNQVASVAGVLLIFFVGFYRLADLQQRRGGLSLPMLACGAFGVVCFGVLYRFAGQPLLLSLVCSLGVFSSMAIMVKLFSAIRAWDKVAGSIAHFGVVLLVVAAFAGTEKSIEMPLAEGKTLPLGGWEFSYESFEAKVSGGVEQAGPRIAMRKGSVYKRLWPHRDTYPGKPELGSVSRPAINTGWFEDICISYGGLAPDGGVRIAVRARTFMFWLWLGGALIIAGSALAVVEGRTGRQPMAE